MSAQVFTILLAVIAAVGASLVTGILARPKTKADADAVRTSAQVAVSADSREWVLLWMGRATAAEEKAEHAEKAADTAQAEATEAKERARAAEQHVTLLTAEVVALRDYCRGLMTVMESAGMTVPPPPEVLRS